MQEESKDSVTQGDRNEFVIAALGASAGGLEPLEHFFDRMPADAGIAFVIVQHLAPNHATALPELLGRHTQMPVEQTADNTKIEPNRVYVIPPNATLTIKDGTLRVTAPVEARGTRTPIDSLFSSLAEDRGENAVCILLSGTGTDGTLGLRAIKEHGGMAMAQTLESARYDAMLRSAIATGLVDHVLPVEEMPAKLTEYAAYLVSLNGKPNHIREQIGAHMNKIHAVLRQRAGHDFSQYKENTIARRLERRMKAAQIDTVEEYIELLGRQPEEADRLFNDLLIGVTHFFRDADAFTMLEKEVIPKVFDGRENGEQVRVSVVGCATGEEAYSMAILLSEHSSTLDQAPPIQVFATDIDEGALETARKGRYPESIAEHVSPERLQRFFIKQDNAYLVKREIREICLFSLHSFIKDPPFSRLDLISCRNVMIYLSQDLQQKIIPLFHYALRPGGYLFLGPSESASSHRELFEAVDKKHRIFRRKETLPSPSIAFPFAETMKPIAVRADWQEPDERSLTKQLERIILQRYRPACVIVRENGEAVYFSGRISRFLEQPTGSPDANVINMAREGLRIPLRTTLHRAVTTRERAIQKQISVQTDGMVSQIDLLVEPIPEFHSANLYMIVFEDVAPFSGPTQGATTALNASVEETIRHLEDELRSAHERAQSMFEELESSNEELRSANEEYQSTNEELETSKEELQSYNEELQTVNAEVSRKVTELDHANSDLQNLLNSTQVATLFLDRELRIRNFTPAAGIVFRLIPGDLGRPITDLAAQFATADLGSDIQEVLRTLIPLERQLAGSAGLYYQMRVLPYRTVHNVIDGVVLTFADVTGLKRAELLIAEAKIYAENIVETVREPLLVLDAAARVKSANRAFYDMFQVSPTETVNALLFSLGGGQWNIPKLRRLIGEILHSNKAVEDFEVDHDFPSIGRRTMLLNARKIPMHGHNAPLILLAIEDITERKQVEERRLELQAREHMLASEKIVREKDAEIARIARALTVGELTTSIAHEINQPLAGVVTNAEAGLRWLGGDTPNVHEAKESLKLIVRDGNRASAVIKRVREFVKKARNESASLDIKEIIHETLALARAELFRNGISLSLELSDDIPTVRGDRVLLEQVILNLITNACEAMAPVSDRARELLVTTQTSGDGAVLVSVRDSGIGIKPQEIDRIYDTFFTTKPMGMGMGLSISRSIIEAHGGRIWAAANDGAGVTVQFTLPAENVDRS